MPRRLSRSGQRPRTQKRTHEKIGACDRNGDQEDFTSAQNSVVEFVPHSLNAPLEAPIACL